MDAGGRGHPLIWIWLENDRARRKNFCLFQIEVRKSDDDSSDFRVTMLNVAVRHDASWEPPTFADTVFEVCDQACLEIGIDATSVASLGFEANLPDDGEQSRRHVATDASGSVDEMDACFEVGLQPEASAMIVFSVRNSRVAVMAESLRTGHRPARV